MSEEQIPAEPEAPEFLFDWMPLAVGNVEIVNWDGHSYVDRAGRTYWSGQEPSAEDAADAVTTPRAVPPTVPQSVKPWQMRRAINAADLRASVDAALAQADRDTQDGWEVASEIRRDNPLIADMATTLGLTPAQVDALFIAAGTKT